MDGDLPWLAGIMDGEGSYSFIFGNPPSGRKFVSGRLNWTPQMIFGLLENEAFQLKVERIFATYGIKFGKYYEPPRVGKERHSPRGIWHYTIQRWENIIKLSKLLLPHLTVKRPHAELFLKSYAHRPRLLTRGHDEKGFFRKVEWDNLEKLIELVESVRALNGNKQNVKWTAERIRQVYRNGDGERFYSKFVGDNPRRRRQ